MRSGAIEDISLTTNGVDLAESVEELREAGLGASTSAWIH